MNVSQQIEEALARFPRFRWRMLLVLLALPGLLVCLPRAAKAQITLLNQFNPGQGQLIGTGFDATTDNVFVYGLSPANIQRFTRTGGAAGSAIARPGEPADDADLDFASEDFMLGNTLVPAGSLLFVNGETSTADISAVNKDTGAVIATLTASFGNSHVVGIGYHAARDSLFLVADRNDSQNPNIIAEINPLNGTVLNRFGTGSADYTVNFGDLDVSQATGNLHLVSSDENTIRVLTPTGSFVQDMALPSGISGLSGIAIDDTRGEAFLSSTNGTVYHISGLTAVPEPGTVALAITGLLPMAGAALRRRRNRRA